MTSLIFLSILAAFFQTASLEIDLVILILISRTFLVSDRQNYYLGFFLGLLVSLLSNQPLGYHSVVYLVIIKLVEIFKNTAFSSNWLLTLPFTTVLIIFYHLVMELNFRLDLYLTDIVWEALLFLPILIIVKVIQERLTVRTNISLKVRS